jgi:hypothetical protein
MGVPKFFRWMSERYPAISQLIAENRIPEFDCLYLDMNGIIHNCTHKDSDDATFRMSEEQMFIAIFNYIEPDDFGLHSMSKLPERRRSRKARRCRRRMPSIVMLSLQVYILCLMP